MDLAVVWSLDFWGKYRRQTEAARANLLASQWGRRAVLTSVISNVASAYFTLRELDLALDVSKMTLDARQDSLRLTSVLAKNGSASGLDERQSEQLVYTAAETIPDLERQIVLQENSLSILIGRNPGPIPRGSPSSRIRPRFLSAWLRNCWSAAPTSRKRNRIWWRRMPRLASPRPRFFPVSRSPVRPDTKASRSTTCLATLKERGTGLHH